ncbi:conserved hypothetical protein [Rubrivivax sp. A210]|uniref:YdeI/OmpD-associated family protein n=1 Tax=Rubrivivax sp. A210 TaxID=2772301 RepID=UPI00191B0E4A|nr:YdeI/OmpD-associated family protein [Rubrivivax sp. A210]CAD5369689.1 conserved hypothetical protein [Rubrivivax sp. A210]
MPPKADLPILAFETAAAWEAWLAAQPAGAPGLWLRLAKKGAGRPSVSRREAIDGALCHGWIDGQLAPHDDQWWLVYFTPRSARSKWSQINREAAQALIEAGRMAPAGLAQVHAARADGRWDAAYAPQRTATVPDDLRAALAASPQALRFFEGLKGANRYAILHRVADAKLPATRARRIANFVTMLEKGEVVYPPEPQALPKRASR